MAGPLKRAGAIAAACGVLLALAAPLGFGHGVEEGDAAFIAGQAGVAFGPYFYLGAKHMVTGYDHLLFLAGVIFFLYRLRDVTLYVTLFAVGHSLTLLAGVLADIPANAYLVDTIIGLSVVYKAFENLGGFRHLGINIDTRAAVFAFGLCHGFGLATKLQAISLANDGLTWNLLSFNLGVELGQLAALLLMLACFNLWRMYGSFTRLAVASNWLLLVAGFMLAGYQLTGYFVAT